MLKLGSFYWWWIDFYRRELTYEEVIERLKEKNITIRMASPKLVMEEAPESYKDVEDVCNTCNFK